MARKTGDHGPHGHRRGGVVAAQTVAVTILTGIVAGVLVGYCLDRVLHTVPWLSVIGLFAGFGVALAAVFFETR